MKGRFKEETTALKKLNEFPNYWYSVRGIWNDLNWPNILAKTERRDRNVIFPMRIRHIGEIRHRLPVSFKIVRYPLSKHCILFTDFSLRKSVWNMEIIIVRYACVFGVFYIFFLYINQYYTSSSYFSFWSSSIAAASFFCFLRHNL